MRGKKIDNHFLSDFITQCIQQNKNSPVDIAIAAKTQISIIDDKIKEVEKLKIVRSKLLDVITTFDVPDNSTKIEEMKILSFYDIKNPNICKFICESIKKSTIKITSLKHDQFSDMDMIYAIKQLAEHKVIFKIKDCILRGSSYEDYNKYVLKE